LFVPKNSGKKRCRACLLTWNAQKAKEWYREKPRECRAKAGQMQKLKRRADPQYRLYITSKKSAKSRGLEHTLSPEDISVPDLCPVLNCPMSMNTPYAASVDRVDSSKGYVPGNIQVMSWKANTMKNNATEEELRLFAAWVRKTYGQC
jgi:hypothetical protein